MNMQEIGGIIKKMEGVFIYIKKMKMIEKNYI
jgi:hypothetical protein